MPMPELDLRIVVFQFLISQLRGINLCPLGGRFIIFPNGKIYNYIEMRTCLQESGSAPNQRGHSDTETLLAGFEAWGIEATVQKTIGMFAFADWDKHTRTLTLTRDRIGEKLLYYG